jgi:hypothetical protein
MTYIDREILLNNLAVHLVDVIGECSVYSQERLRRLAYQMVTTEQITEEMDEEVLRRVCRIKQQRKAALAS